MGPQDGVLPDIESVLHVAGGMVSRCVEGLEVVTVELHLRTFLDIEPHAGKYIDHFTEGPAEGILVAE